MIWNRAGF